MEQPPPEPERNPIAQLGQPVLRRPADPVPPEMLRSPEFRQAVARMMQILEQTGGVGLAGPQVFLSRRVFLAAFEDPDDPDTLDVEVFVNPRLVSLSAEKESAWEGCLSFPELSVLVPRHKQVRVEYLDLEGQTRLLDLAGFPARVVQHEYDHLDGILTIDRAASTRDIIKASELKTVLEQP
jgi:peptide deformylase